MKRWVLVTTFVVGCGGSQRGANDPRAAERARIEAMRPKSPYETRVLRGYTAQDTCGQGPYRIEATALGAKYGEQIEINICAPRSLQGDFRFVHGTDKGEPQHFGSRNNSEYCFATAAERGAVAAPASSSGGGRAASSSTSGGASSASSSGAGHSASSSVASATPVALTAMTSSVGETCPEGMYLTGILDYSSVSTSDGVPWEAGLPLVLELWAAEPLHLDGAIFVLIQRGVRTDMTTDQWVSYRAESERWEKIWEAYLAGEVTAGRAEYADMTARTADAPPPPRADAKPPKPSTHAEWIVGYWQRDRDWIWSPGFWRVPEADIVAQQTIEAPVAPPPMKTEAPAPAVVAQPPAAPITPAAPTPAAPTQPAPAVSVNLVWTPGYWSWNGTAYVWIEGAWRIPPQGGARWVAPTWTSHRGRFVLVPGGWSVRIRR